MAGKTPQEAVRNFIKPLQQVLSCFTKAVLIHSGDYEVNGGPYALGVGKHNVKFQLPGGNFYLTVLMNYTIVAVEGERGPYKVQTTAYQYMLEDEEEKELFAYQWHPNSTMRFPHLRKLP